jgi:hypothetical protein
MKALQFLLGALALSFTSILYAQTTSQTTTAQSDSKKVAAQPAPVNSSIAVPDVPKNAPVISAAPNSQNTVNHKKHEPHPGVIKPGTAPSLQSTRDRNLPAQTAVTTAPPPNTLQHPKQSAVMNSVPQPIEGKALQPTQTKQTTSAPTLTPVQRPVDKGAVIAAPSGPAVSQPGSTENPK